MKDLCMLAATLEKLENWEIFPVLCTPKLDGIRALAFNFGFYSRNGKEIRNENINKKMAQEIDYSLDGELMGKDFLSTQSIVNSKNKDCSDIKYYVFDIICNDIYINRMKCLKELSLPSFCVKILPTEINNLQDLIGFEQKCIDDGYEGIMLRDPNGLYKYGRSTLNEKGLVKYKRFLTTEAIVVDFIEKTSNSEIKINEVGRQVRGNKLENNIPQNTLGSLQVSYNSQVFNIGSGFTDDQRKEIWENKEKYFHKKIEFKYQELSQYGIPRFPTFFRFLD